MVSKPLLEPIFTSFLGQDVYNSLMSSPTLEMYITRHDGCVRNLTSTRDKGNL